MSNISANCSPFKSLDIAPKGTTSIPKFLVVFLQKRISLFLSLAGW
ncbi:MAG: hypothetical protein ACJ0QS_07300 [Parvicellaceae bacterium]